MTTPQLLDALPCSIELPAGGGKTWLLADTVREAALRAGKSLVLTHTHAGVQSIQSKMRELGVPSDAAHVGTITSLAFELVRGYSHIAGLEVPEVPNWDDSTEYNEGARRVLQNRHIRDVYAVSYSHLLVDEYQDCSLSQHALVLDLVQAIPACVVFGDPLQGIFGFRDPIVDWESDVLPHFPAFAVDYVPRRWLQHNQPLGEWLLRVRPQLQPGSQLGFGAGLPDGVAFIAATAQGWELPNVALQQRPQGESVVVIAPPDKHSARTIASRLKGVYTTMEDIGGNFMAEALAILEAADASQYPLWLARLAKQCFVGYTKLNETVLNRLAKGLEVSGLNRPGLERTLSALDRVLANPTYESLAVAMRDIRSAREAQLHSREAWNDIASALESGSSNAQRSPTGELGRVRDRLRHGGRPSLRRVVSRTVLIKGLEYDHVIISNLERISDNCNLYVALTRARKSVTVIGRKSTVTLTETTRSPRVSARDDHLRASARYLAN